MNHQIEQLSNTLLQPWMACKRFDTIRSDVDMLVQSLTAYKRYLVTQSTKANSRHQQALSQDVEENASLLKISSNPNNSCPSQYQELEEMLSGVPLYQPVFVNDISPIDRYERRKWLSELALPFPIMLYKYAYGNSLGTLVHAWRIPEDESVDNTKISQIFSQLCRKQSFYSSRAMRRDFLNKYSCLAKISKMVLRNIYRTLLQDHAAAEYVSEAQVDERVANAVLQLDDTEIVLDLRKMNGKPNSTIFDKFWHELQLYFDEVTLAVDERRHGDIMHMPLAISIRSLQETISDRLLQKFPDSVPPVPSQEWIRLQFWPCNPYTDRAIRYTGQFKIKFGVQIRQMRKEHPDSHYVSALLKYVYEFAVKYRNEVLLLSVDDKCIVPVGEPNCPISTGVRGHNRSLVPATGPQLQALDHDFHLHGIVPSVAFVIDIPERVSDTFYRGHAYVTSKDKVTQPSHALRHATELTELVLTRYSDDGHAAAQPIAIIVSDGGPDHRVTFGSVKVSSLTLFCALDLDMLICVRTCPYQSWQNIAERIMSTLNLALQNVSLARTCMTDQFEKLVKNSSSLSEIRELIKQYPDLYGCLQDSMAAPLCTVGRRFQCKENPVAVGVPASEASIDAQFQHALSIDSSLQKDDLTAKGLENALLLKLQQQQDPHNTREQ